MNYKVLFGTEDFHRLHEDAEPLQLTKTGLEAGAAPDTDALKLDEVEGKVIKISGSIQGGRIYSAKVISAQVFRANVGVVSINAQGEVLALKRSGAEGVGAWQLPQGGLDELEEPREAAERELNEELGLEPNCLEFLLEHPEWLAYELPPEARRTKAGKDAKHGRGQVQKWLLARLVGQEHEINLGRWVREHGEEPEFDAMRWTSLSEIAELAWEPRSATCRKLAADFRPHVKTNLNQP